MGKKEREKIMCSSGQGEIEELFIIKTDKIDFYGAIIKKKAGDSEVYGRVCIGNGMYFFRHPADHKAVLREKLQTMCKTIADHYETEVIHQKYDTAIEINKSISLN